MKVDINSVKDILKSFASKNSVMDNLLTVILAIYIVYGAFSVPFAFYLLSLSIGLIVFGALESFEAAVIATVVSGVLAVIISQSNYGKQPVVINTSTKEGFENTSDEAPSQDSAEIIARRVAKIDRNKPSEPGPLGVLASDYVESFQDVSEMQTAEQTGQASTNTTSTTESSSNTTATTAATKAETAAVAPQSSPAPVNTAAPMPASNTGTATQTNAVEAALATGSGTNQVNANLGQNVASNVAQITKQGFKGSQQPDGLFKLGEIPRDLKGGFHIDQGTTVLNALNALKPDQVKQMSEDTQKLIDTQKSLMSMLGTMKPMMADGKQLLETFQQMFGPNSAPSSVGQA